MGFHLWDQGTTLVTRDIIFSCRFKLKALPMWLGHSAGQSFKLVKLWCLWACFKVPTEKSEEEKKTSKMIDILCSLYLLFTFNLSRADEKLRRGKQVGPTSSLSQWTTVNKQLTTKNNKFNEKKTWIFSTNKQCWSNNASKTKDYCYKNTSKIAPLGLNFPAKVSKGRVLQYLFICSLVPLGIIWWEIYYAQRD